MDTKALKKHHLNDLEKNGLKIVATFDEPGNGISALVKVTDDECMVLTYWEDGRTESETIIGERQARIAYGMTIKELLTPAICRVDSLFACPSCDEDDMDKLSWESDTKVECLTCHTIYTPEG